MKVVVGMSGGVDSSVTAYLLKEQGYEVEGLSFILYEARLKNTFAGCCSIESINDARRTAESIGVVHTAVDLRGEFMAQVIEPFIDAYAKGITPNPCILCNKYIKFPHLLKIANGKDAEFISTGHYARVEESDKLKVTGDKSDKNLRDSLLAQPQAGPLSSASRLRRPGWITRHTLLKKGIDQKKDQSYVLYILRREELRRLKLPLGEKRKDEVREIARRLDLPAAKRPESQEICFIEDRNYFKFIEHITEYREGPIIAIETGKVLGKHRGIHLYTIGQRKRMGVATGRPLYVVRIDPSENIVYVGSKESAMMKEFLVEDLNWLTPPSPPLAKGGMGGVTTFRATVKVRSMMRDEPATISFIDENRVRVTFDEPQWAPAPGQSAVFYDGDVVIGGGVIAEVVN